MIVERNDCKSSSRTSSALSLIIIYMLSPFECITRSSSSSLEEIKLIATVSWIFYVSDFLRLSMMPFKCRLILLRYSSADSVLFLSPSLLYSK